ncbi:MAG: hypothetical protein C0606_11095 [Hyphomicrobiales bacterium]|nr:MAG: hypothetical protein C0606_11095 [Hyphomicrobiales bacterium]
MPSPIRKSRLTDAFVKSTKCAASDGQTVDYFDAIEGGLAIRVSPTGRKTWTLRFRPQGSKSQRRLTLGRFDPASGPGHMGVHEARLAAKAAKVSVGKGDDPAAAKAIAKRELSEAPTLREVGEAYFAKTTTGEHRLRGKPKRPRTIADERAYFDRLVAPALGSRKIAAVGRHDIDTFLSDQSSRGAARQCRVVLNAIFNFAVWKELAPANPVTFVAAPTFEARERILTDGELRILWSALEQPDGFKLSRAVALAIELAAVTGQRRGEVAGMRVAEIDVDATIWTIPGSRTKNKRTHAVPLSPKALAIILEAKTLAGSSEYLFPSPRRAGDDDKPITAGSLSHAWRRLCSAVDLNGIRPHDLRRTMATRMTERLGIPRFIVSRVLNHTSDSGGAAAVTAIYDRAEYSAEKRDALEKWAGLLRSIVRIDGA